MTGPRTINLNSTWREAMTIYLAALEHGTGDGREAARKELQRVAEMLDSLAEQDRQPRGVFEVITDGPGKPAYGITFGTAEEAQTYSERMTAAGYTDATCAVTICESAADGLAEAADFYGDDTLLQQEP